MAKYPDATIGQTEACINRLGGWDNFIRFIGGQGQVVFETAKVVVEETKVYLKRLFSAKLGATDGTDTYETATKVFSGWFDSDFKNWGIIFSGVAPEIGVDIDELVRDGKFSDFFGNTASDLKKCHLLGSQFLKFCREHPDKLRKDGYGTFFLLTRGDEPINEDFSNVFVASADFDDLGRLWALVFEFSFDNVWYAEDWLRVVAPQQ